MKNIKSDHMHQTKTSELTLGNKAVRAKQYDDAILHYNNALNQTPGLRSIILDNLIALEKTKARDKTPYITREPLGEQDKSTTNHKKFALICHFYYEDLVDDLAFYINNVTQYASLYFTVPIDNFVKLSIILKSLYPKAVIIPTANQGSDIYPFLVALKAIINENTSIKYICKIHTKHGTTHYPDVWREVLLESLLGTKESVELICNTLTNDSNLGMIGPALLFNSNKAMIYGNNDNINKLLKILEWGSEHKDWAFFAGTMFWSRIDIISPLANLLDNDDINWQSHTTDGNIAHAIERIFGLATIINNKSYGLISNHKKTPTKTLIIKENNLEKSSKISPSQNLSGVASDFRKLIALRKTDTFDTDLYKKEYQNYENEHFNPLMHYLKYNINDKKYFNQQQKLIETNSFAQTVEKTRLFDEQFYLNIYKDVKNAGGNANNHYLKFGLNKRNPNPLFNARWYKDKYNLTEIDVPLLDYLINSSSTATRNPHPLFISDWYRNTYITDKSWKTNPLGHYLSIGRYCGYTPHPTYNAPLDSRSVSTKFYPNSSPIIARVPPALYLESYCDEKPKLKGNRFHTLDQFIVESITNPRLITSTLTENDLRIIGVMDTLKRTLADSYFNTIQLDLVSIIMPTKNRDDLIFIAISSILNQSYLNWELIVVDDGGYDKTKTVINSINDPRIKYVRIEESIGNAGARNYGLAQSSGSLISFLDDDDQWDPDFLLISVNHLRQNNSLMIYSAQAVWDGYEPVKQLGMKFNFIRFGQFNRALLENSNYISMISCVIDKSIYDHHNIKFDESLNRLVDWDYFLRVTEVTTPVALPCILSHYFLGHTTGSVTHSYDRDKCLNAVRERLTSRVGGSQKIKYNSNSDILDIYPPKQKTNHKPATNSLTNIIIPNYECYDELKVCIESIEAVTKTPYRIVIVDNKSSLITRSNIIKYINGKTNISLITYDEYAGFTFAVNAGIKYVFENFDGDILILNNDTFVTNGWLEYLQDVLSLDNEVGMVVPRQVLPPNHEISKYHSPDALIDTEVDINLSAHHKNIIKPYSLADGSLFELNYAPMFCSLIRRNVAEAIGFLDAGNGPHFRSDWIYCDILRYRFFKKIIYSPYSKVYHLQGISTKVSSHTSQLKQ
jgi:GT2 family glycosyltransferase